MIKYKNGNILDAKENIICHQVNVDGVMGGGLAKQIASSYPNVESEYKAFADANGNDYERLKGTSLIVKISENQIIANCFTQKSNFETDYIELDNCFKKICMVAKNNNYSIAIPYKYGCGIAKGDWNIVEGILNKLSEEYEIDFVIYKYEEA